MKETKSNYSNNIIVIQTQLNMFNIQCSISIGQIKQLLFSIKLIFYKDLHKWCKNEWEILLFQSGPNVIGANVTKKTFNTNKMFQ